MLARYQGTRLTDWIESKLEGWLGLEINREKTRNALITFAQVVRLKEEGASLDFPGFTFRYYDDLEGRGWRYLHMGPSAKSLGARALKRIEEGTGEAAREDRFAAELHTDPATG